MEDNSPERRSGCGLLNAVFGHRSIWPSPRRSTSMGSLQTVNVNNGNVSPSTPNSRRRRSGSDHSSFLGSPDIETEKNSQNNQVDRIIARPAQNHMKSPPMYHQHQTQPVYQHNNGRKTPPDNETTALGRKMPQGTIGLSGELESMITDHQRSKGAGTFVRASSGNVMLFGNLGNLRQLGNNGNTNSTCSILDYLPKTAKEEPPAPNGKYTASNPSINAVKNRNADEAKPVSLCRALSTRMDPEELKVLGNEDYKNGRFAEAVALYDAAISIDPNKASYRSNKSAALTALGKLLEAAFECREAIRIEPSYQRAHNRLATLCLRLGDAEKAIYHFKNAGVEADPDVVNKAKNVLFHLNKCTEAKRQRDWKTLQKESGLAIEAGADSAPLIFALKAEALLKLHKHQDADETMVNGPNFEVDECTKFFGPIGSANLMVVQAQVDMAAGRFDDAVAAAQRASRLDSNNKEVNIVLRKTRAVATARSKGNDLFKAARFSEASGAYEEGLSHDPSNAVLLCNRGACRSKLGQYEKAVEDCNYALSVRPSYSKARLRRGDCYAKLGRWEECIQDCEVLTRENPDDKEVGQMLKEAQSHLSKQEINNMNQETNISGTIWELGA
ncbi:tetratricopeptide repeat (TPR)-containing protein [Forsythia ovata]|uniref:Tetratricopeptide repeat (TPR)-containing protein n=1 Tax=Forsythia ovata TaxID=205694 RepID=A0ABD1UT35_9LAMI